MRNWILKIPIISGLLILGFNLPIIPVQTAPVLPNAVYRLNVVSLHTVYEALDGIHHRMEWYSYLVAVVLLVLAYFIGDGISRLLVTLLWGRREAE